jgi:hypothetical protein
MLRVCLLVCVCRKVCRSTCRVACIFLFCLITYPPCLFLRLPVKLPPCLSVYLSIYLSECVSVCSVCLSVSVEKSVGLPVVSHVFSSFRLITYPPCRLFLRLPVKLPPCLSTIYPLYAAVLAVSVCRSPSVQSKLPALPPFSPSYLPVYLSICLSTYLNVCLYAASLSACLCLSKSLSVYLSCRMYFPLFA